GLGATGDKNIGFPDSDVVESIYQSVGAGGTGAHCGKVGASESIAHGNVSGGYVEDKFGNEKGVEPRCTITGKETFHFFDKGDHTPDTRTPNYSNAILVDIRMVDAGMGDSFAGCPDGNLRKAVHFSGFFFIQIILRIEVF